LKVPVQFVHLGSNLTCGVKDLNSESRAMGQ